jgi:hypothetical protein
MIKRYYIKPDSIINSYTGEWIRDEYHVDPDGDWVKFEDVRELCDDILNVIAKGTCNRSKYKLWEEKVVEILKSIRDEKC